MDPEAVLQAALSASVAAAVISSHHVGRVVGVVLLQSDVSVRLCMMWAAYSAGEVCTEGWACCGCL